MSVKNVIWKVDGSYSQKADQIKLGTGGLKRYKKFLKTKN